MNPNNKHIEFDQLNGGAKIWQPEDGWLGLMPGKSSLADAITKLGPFEIADKFYNGTRYEFAKSTIHVYVLDEQITIAKIRLYKGADEQFVPNSVDDLEKIVGPLKQTEASELAIATLECRGLRVEANLFGNPQSIRWVEFYSV